MLGMSHAFEFLRLFSSKRLKDLRIIFIDIGLVYIEYLILSLDPHADTGALTPSADWMKCCFY